MTRDGWKWTTEQWDGSEQPYQQIRKRIDDLADHGADLLALSNANKSVADAAPNDPKAQYAWAYAAWKFTRLPHESEKRYSLLQDIPEALAATPSPHSYEYARMRFIIQSSLVCKPQLRSVGKRLLQREPSDDDVKNLLVRVYIPVQTLAEKAEAIAYLRQLIAENPKKASYQATYGWIYMTSYEALKQPSDADKAISYFQTYLRIAPADDDYRASVPGLIHYVQYMKATAAQRPTESVGQNMRDKGSRQ